MGTNISWTEQTWNPIVGCSITSPGCTNCYAMKMANRICKMDPGSHYRGTVKTVNGKPVWTGQLNRAPKYILQKPLKRKKPTMYFVNSMSDLFHEDMPKEWIDEVFAVMALCPQHTFQVLTKRAEKMHKYFTNNWQDRWISIEGKSEDMGFAPLDFDGFDWLAHKQILPNVWLGVSAENQEQANKRIPDLLNTPAAIRFVSLEPQLERIDLSELNEHQDYRNWLSGEFSYVDQDAIDTVFVKHNNANKLDWVIQGCESGPGARYFNLNWARTMRDKCAAAGVPYFLKQSIDENEKLDRSQIIDGVKHDAMPSPIL